MKTGKIEIFYKVAMLLPAFIIVAGCGGGGGHSSSSSTQAQTQLISGVAAAGWPLTGTITVKDSRGVQKSTTSDVSGAYSVDVTGMTAPFVLMADGTIAGVSIQIFSGATQADIGGKINITPFTDLIISNVGGEISSSYYNAGNFSNLTADNLNAQDAKLEAILQPLLSNTPGVSSSTDLLRTFFLTNNTGEDAVIDLLTVTYNSTTNSAVITNVTTQQTVTVNFATQTYINTFSNATTTAASVSSLTSIVNFFNTLSTLFSTSLPSATNSQLLNLFNGATFINNGQDLTAFLTALTSNTANVGLTLNGLSILALNPVAGTAAVKFTTNKEPTQTQVMNFVLVNGSWLAEGNLNGNIDGSTILRQ